MRVHNFHADTMLGLSRFLNNKVLHGRPINHFQFNTGDSGLQLDYESGYSLPAAIFNLERISPYQNKPYVFQHRSGNVHTIPVLYDREKDLILKVQEEEFTVNINVLINCSNHNQAIDLQHQLLSYIPPNKYMHFYEFVTFLEVDDFLINKWMFDINKDTIDNLFLKQNRFTDTLDYSFGLKVRPLLRFSDFQIQLSGDSNQETFQVSTEVEYLITIPVYLYYPKLNMNSDIEPEHIIVTREDVNIPMNKEVEYRRIWAAHVEPNYNFRTYMDVPIYIDTQEPIFSSNLSFIGRDQEVVEGTVSGEITGENINFNFDTIFDGVGMNGSGTLFHDYKENKITGELKGYTINGSISEVNRVNDEIIECKFEGTINSTHLEKDIVLEYTTKDKSKILTNIKTIFNNSSYVLISNEKVQPNNIYTAITDVARLNNEIVPNKTLVSKLIFRSKEEPHAIIEHILDEPIPFRNDGFINRVINIPAINNTKDIELTIHLNTEIANGDIETIKFEYNNEPEIEMEYDLDVINIETIDFKMILNHLGTYIDRINVDMDWSEGSVIAGFLDESINPEHKTIIISELLNVEEVVEDYTTTYKFNISINTNAILNFPVTYWKIIIPDYLLTVTSNDEESGVNFDLTNSTENNLIFEVSKTLYMNHFKNINKANPMFLSIG